MTSNVFEIMIAFVLARSIPACSAMFFTGNVLIFSLQLFLTFVITQWIMFENH